MKTKRARKFHGEEAEIVTAEDCKAADAVIAKLQSGELKASDIEVSPPTRKPSAFCVR